MNHRSMGRCGFTCSEVGLGTWAFASRIYGDVAENDALRTIHAALDAGITLFDTAPLYGTADEDGVAEILLGRGLGAARNEVLISSKFGRYATDRAAPNFHAQRARESVEGSLRRLGTDRIDILFFHSPFGPEDIHDDVWEELDRLRTEGKIRVIGHSISKFEETESMARSWAAERRIDVIQVVYSLMNRQSSRLIADLGAAGVGIVARESLANGFLSGTVTADTVFPAGSLNARYSREEIAERVEYVNTLSFLVDGEIHSMPQAAYRWVLDNPHVTVVLSGARNAVELSDAVFAAKVPPFTADEHAHAAAWHIHDFQAA